MVERAALEMRFTGNRNVGSNPTLSATQPSVLLKLARYLANISGCARIAALAVGPDDLRAGRASHPLQYGNRLIVKLPDAAQSCGAGDGSFIKNGSEAEMREPKLGSIR